LRAGRDLYRYGVLLAVRHGGGQQRKSPCDHRDHGDHARSVRVANAYAMASHAEGLLVQAAWVATGFSIPPLIASATYTLAPLSKPNRHFRTSIARLARFCPLKAERASLAAQGRQIESEAAPVNYVAELIDVDTRPSGQSAG
jgi:hypothetical protein